MAVRQTQQQPYAERLVQQQHLQALTAFGEYAMLVLLWQAQDFLDGLVGRCPLCWQGEGRPAAAYAQGARHNCPNCYGTSFEGGFRARLIRPCLFSDSTDDTTQGPRGELHTDTVNAETTADFTAHRGDYIFRASGDRLQCSEGSPVVIRSGVGNLFSSRAVSQTIGAAVQEDPSSVVHIIPPTPVQVAQVLDRPAAAFTAPDLDYQEVVRGPLVR